MEKRQTVYIEIRCFQTRHWHNGCLRWFVREQAETVKREKKNVFRCQSSICRSSKTRKEYLISAVYWAIFTCIQICNMYNRIFGYLVISKAFYSISKTKINLLVYSYTYVLVNIDTFTYHGDYSYFVASI